MGGKAALYEEIAATGKALGNGKRLELLDLLAQGERSVEVLARRAGLNLTTASAHLQVLKQAGLVSTRRDGVRVHYRMAGPDVAALFALLRTVAHAHRPGVDSACAAFLGPGVGEPVGRADLLARVRAGEVVVLDVRPVEEYSAGHVPGAVCIPVEELADRLAELPTDVPVVAYCRDEYCVLSYQAVRLLTARGRPAARLDQGMLEWRLAELPVATGDAA